MSDLGALLRKAREQRGYSLEDVQDLTKIRKRYLEAIEAGDYSVLPGSFYVRAFVKNYAENVGLDADEVLRLYQKEIPARPPEADVETVQRPRRAQTHTSDRWSRLGFRALMWSFFILIVVIVYVFYVNRPDNGVNVDTADDQTKMTDQVNPPKETNNGTETNAGNTNGQSATVPETVTPEPTPEPAPAAPSATTLTLTRTSGSMDYYAVSPAGTHKVEFKVSGGNCWIGIKENSKSGKYVLNKSLNDGESTFYDITGPVYISVGNAGRVAITIDGVPVEDGNKAGPRRFQLNPSEGTENAQADPQA